VLVVNPTKLPVKNAKELLAALKAKPDFYNFASSGNGTIIHLAARCSSTPPTSKPSTFRTRASARWSTDIIGGQVDFGVVAVNAALQAHPVRQRCVPVGVDGRRHASPSLPDLPTMTEQGLPRCRRRRLVRRHRARQDARRRRQEAA
jgi:tripartite-type tricarboxylate transporter receptor subunit TctC